jgi:hypothetical protein
VSAERELKGILARTMTGNDLEALLDRFYWERSAEGLSVGPKQRAPWEDTLVDWAAHWCLHPNQRSEFRQTTGGWRKWRTGRRWQYKWVPPQAYWKRTCPDCPAMEFHRTPPWGGVLLPDRMPPWIVGPKDKERNR